eukprot:4879377-Amphidinium_carterae.2
MSGRADYWLVAFYGYAGKPEDTEQLGADMLQHLFELVPGPACICGDFNSAADGQTWIAELFQLDWLCLHEIESTCWVAEEGTCVDFILIHPSLRGTLLRPKMLQDHLAWKPHRPLEWFAEVHGPEFQKLWTPPLLTREPASVGSALHSSSSREFAHSLGGKASQVAHRCGALKLVRSAGDSLLHAEQTSGRHRRCRELHDAVLALQALQATLPASFKAFAQKRTHATRTLMLRSHPLLQRLAEATEQQFPLELDAEIDLARAQMQLLLDSFNLQLAGDRRAQWQHTKHATSCKCCQGWSTTEHRRA